MEWFVIGLTLVGLALGGHHFVIGAAAIGRRCGMSPVLIGATIVAFGTSLPEWGVSMFAAWQGFTDISTGNVLGSNTFNILFVLGSAAVIRPLGTSHLAVREAGIFAGLMLLALGILWSKWIVSRWEGATLATAGCAWYLLGT